jgi:hypothetical protein
MMIKFGICPNICGFKAKGLVTASAILLDFRIMVRGGEERLRGGGRNECRNL